jgi:hypothetical protein
MSASDLPIRLLNNPKKRRVGHPAYRIPLEIVASVGPVPSPGDYFDRLLWGKHPIVTGAISV